MRITHWFDFRGTICPQCLSPRMHQTSNNPNGYESLRVTPIACGLEVPKRHGKTRLFINLHLSYSSIRNYQQWRFAKTRLIFNFYAHISCNNDWNNFLLLNTNPPFNIAMKCMFVEQMYQLFLPTYKSCGLHLFFGGCVHPYFPLDLGFKFSCDGSRFLYIIIMHCKCYVL